MLSAGIDIVGGYHSIEGIDTVGGYRSIEGIYTVGGYHSIEGMDTFDEHLSIEGTKVSIFSANFLYIEWGGGGALCRTKSF